MFQDQLHTANSHAKAVWVFAKSNKSDADVVLGNEPSAPVKQHLVLHWTGKMYPAGARYMGDFRTHGMPTAPLMETLIQLFLVTVMRMLDKQAQLFNRRSKKRKFKERDEDANEEQAVAKLAYQPGSVRVYLEEITSTSGEHVSRRVCTSWCSETKSPAMISARRSTKFSWKTKSSTRSGSRRRRRSDVHTESTRSGSPSPDSKNSGNSRTSTPTPRSAATTTTR